MSSDLNFFFETFSLNTEPIKEQAALEAKDFVKSLNLEKGSLYLPETSLSFIIGRKTEKILFDVEVYEADDFDGVIDLKPNNAIMFIDLCVLRMINSYKSLNKKNNIKWLWSALFITGDNLGHFPLPVKLFPIDKKKRGYDQDINPEAAKKALAKLFGEKINNNEF